MQDVRDILFKDLEGRQYSVVITAEHAGVLSGVEDAYVCAEQLGIDLELCKGEGAHLSRGERFGHFRGTAKQIAQAEEQLMGTLAKSSGIATAAETANLLAQKRVRIVSGSWKKMPPVLKQSIRRAIASGGAAFRICEPPMVYIDKNYIRMLGSIPAALAAAKPLENATKIIQIKGQNNTIEEETRQALEGGADVLMVDTGNREDLKACRVEVERQGRRGQVKLAFAGNVKLTDIPVLADAGVDILCIGKQIVDAQLLDMRLDVVEEVQSWV